MRGCEGGKVIVRNCLAPEVEGSDGDREGVRDEATMRR